MGGESAHYLSRERGIVLRTGLWRRCRAPLATLRAHSILKLLDKAARKAQANRIGNIDGSDGSDGTLMKKPKFCYYLHSYFCYILKV